MKTITLYSLYLLCFSVLIVAQGKSQHIHDGSVTVELVSPSVLSFDKQSIVKIKIGNQSTQTVQTRIRYVTTSLEFSNPAGNDAFSVEAGEEKFFPVYVTVPADDMDSIHTIAADIQLSNSDSTWTKLLVQQLHVETITRIVCTVPDNDMLLSEEKQEADLRLTVSNRGNTTKKMIIELKDPEHPDAYPPFSLISFPGRDTVITWNRIAVLQQMQYEEKNYYLTVRDSEDDSRVYFYQLIRVQSLQHTRRHKPYYVVAPNTVGVRYEQWADQRYYSFTGNGNMPVTKGGYNLSYQFYLRKHPYGNGISADQLKVGLGNGEDSFTAGDIYYGQETGLYNRGLSAEVKTGENLFVGGSYTHSDLLPSVFDRTRQEQIASAGVRWQQESQAMDFKYIYHSDKLTGTRTHLLLSSAKKDLNKKGQIEAGLGVSSEIYNNKPVYDAAAFLNLHYDTRKWSFSSANRYSGSSYPFINRGDTHFRQSVTYKTPGPLSMNAEMLIQRFQPTFRYLPSGFTTNYRNTRGSVGLRLDLPRTRYQLSAGIGTNKLFAPYINSNTSYRNKEFFVKGGVQFVRPDLSLQLEQQVARIVPGNAGKPAYFAGVSELNAVIHETYLSLYLNKGAYSFFDQANYVLNGYSRDFFIARISRSFQVFRNFSVELSADHYRDRFFDYTANTLTIAPEFRFRSYRLSYEGGYRIINGNRIFLQNFSLSKDFGNPLQPTHTLRVHAFRDLNMNGNPDASEPPVAGVMLDIAGSRLLTDEKGRAELKKLPEEQYTIRLLDKQNLVSKKNVYNVFLGNSRTLLLPLHQGVILRGKLDIVNGNGPIHQNALRVLVKEQPEGEQFLVPCDHAGNFKLVLKKGKVYEVSVDQSTIPQTYQTTAGSKTVDTHSSNIPELRFIIRKIERKVIRKQFGNR